MRNMKEPEIDGGLLRDRSPLTSFLAALEEVNAPCRVVACGLLCAGKSTLLNALAGRIDEPYFATGAGRTTHACESLDDGAGFRWIDTPGLDVSGEDDAEVWNAIRAADLLLFVHHSGTGELHKAEADFLRAVTTGVDARHRLAERMCVALTHKESLNVDELGRLKDAVRRQVASATGADLALFPVSCTVYFQGKRNRRANLIESSGVPALGPHLMDSAQRIRIYRWRHVADLEEELLWRIDAEAAHMTGRPKKLRRKIAKLMKANVSLRVQVEQLSQVAQPSQLAP